MPNKPKSSSGTDALVRKISRAIKLAVRDGEITPDDALGAVMIVATNMVAQVSDDEVCQKHVLRIISRFPEMVILQREVPPGATRQ